MIDFSKFDKEKPQLLSEQICEGFKAGEIVYIGNGRAIGVYHCKYPVQYIYVTLEIG